MSRSTHANQTTLLLTSIFVVRLLSAQEEGIQNTVDQTRKDASDEALINQRETVDVVEDSSVAEAVERRPDLNFRNVTIDGEKLTVSLDEIPAEAVSSLEVLRAVTPDLDADSRGGSLILESNPTFKLEEPLIKGSLKFEFGENGSTWSKDASFTYGKSFGRFGFTLNGNYSDFEFYGDYISNNWGQLENQEGEFFVPRQLTLQSWDFQSDELSLNLKTDFKLSEIFYVYIRGNYQSQDYQYKSPRLIYRLNDGDFTNLSETYGQSIGGRVDRNLVAYDATDNDDYAQFGGIAKWENTKLDFQSSFDRSAFLEPNFFTIEFEQNEVDLFYDLKDPVFPLVEPLTASIENPENYLFDELLDEVWSYDQTDFISTVNLKHDFNWKDTKGYVKTGLKYRSRELDQTADSLTYTGFNGNFPLTEVLSSDTDHSVLNNRYQLAPKPDVEKSREYFQDNLDQFVLDERRTRERSDSSTYDVKEDISSAYLMFNLEKGRLRGILGSRFEKTDLNFVANEVIIDSLGNYDETLIRTGYSIYDNYFPSIHLRYFLGEKTTIITSWTGTIKRPFYGSIVPYRNINYENQFISEGNPLLRPTLYDNLDLSIDYKLNENSVLSLEVFLKQIDDIVFWEETDITEGEFAGFDLGKYNNGPSAYQPRRESHLGSRSLGMVDPFRWFLFQH